MATTNRLYQDFISFTLDTDPGASGTSLDGPGLADLLVVADPDFIALTLDPEEVNGDSEIVWVSAHTSAAETATIVREQEGTTGRAHPIGTVVMASATAVGLAEAPTHDHSAADEGGVLNAVAWSVHLTSDDDNFTSPLTIPWDAEAIDTDDFWAIGDPTKVIIPTGLDGIYHVDVHATFFNSEANEDSQVALKVDGTTVKQSTSLLEITDATEVEKYVGFSAVLSLSAAEELTVVVSDLTVSGSDLKAPANLTWFSGHRIGA
jgi:hypothetical protein